jgi:hypothetical protein
MVGVAHHSAVSQPFLIQAFLFSGIPVAKKRLDDKLGVLGPKPAANTRMMAAQAAGAPPRVSNGVL